MIFYQRKLKILNKKLKKLYLTDKLTGLYNRFKIDKELSSQKDNIDRNDSYSCGLILIDIDYFKSINDTLGHLVGDCILKDISKFLKNNLQKNRYYWEMGRRRVFDYSSIHFKRYCKKKLLKI